MTTSHRPQLEARSGAKAASYVPTSTQHARLLPGYRKLKYRKIKDRKDTIKNEDGDEDDEYDIDDDKNDTNDKNDDNGRDEETNEDHQEALLLELNNIRKERMIKRIRDEQNLQGKKHDNGWRMTTFGRNRIFKQKFDDRSTPYYVNDIVKTVYHEDFIRRFIK